MVSNRSTRRRRAPALAAVLVAAAPFGPAAAAEARFEVLDEVVNPYVPPVTATVDRIGNGSLLTRDGGGFEPSVWRYRYTALKDSPDRFYARVDQLSGFDVLRDGALDGAEVNVYRIENGAFRRVRKDVVKDGGFVVSTWRSAMPRQRVVPAGEPRYAVNWTRYMRPDQPQWFAVAAVDAFGRVSELSNAVSGRIPTEPERTTAKNVSEHLRPKRGGKAKASDPKPQPPTGLKAEPGPGGSLLLTWAESDDPATVGYRIFRSDAPPESHDGAYLELVGGGGKEPIREGDMAILSKTFDEIDRGALLSNRIWSAPTVWRNFKYPMVSFWPDQHEDKTWSLVPHEPDTPVEEPGSTYLRMELGARGREGLTIRNHSGTDQSFYPVLERRIYRMEVWARSERPGQMVFRVGPHNGDGAGPFTIRTGPEWEKHVVEFEPRRVQTSKRASAMRLELIGPNVYEIDNYRIYRADAPFLAFLPEDVERLKASGVELLRTHAFGKTGVTTYGLEEITNPGGALRHKGGNSLPQTFAAFEQAGVSPWLQIGMHLSPEEWRGLVEYVAAPFDPARDDPADKPWAAKRYAQGREAPWIDAFDHFYFEVANETWNSLFAPWNFTRMVDAETGEVYNKAEAYGLFHDYVVGLMAESPYWESSGLAEKFKSVIGGWRFQTYGRDAINASKTADYLTFAAYNGGWDEGEGPPRRTPASYFSVLNQVSQSILPSAKRHGREAAKAAKARGRPVGVGSYEGGPGYALNGLNGRRVSADEAREQEEVMKSQAAGVAALDSFLAQAAEGAKIQNFFTYGEGRYWNSHARWQDGGQAYPSWRLLSLFNTEGAGEMLATRKVEGPRVDLAAVKKRQAVEDAPTTSVYATRRPGRLTLFVFSRRIPGYPSAGDDGYTDFEIDLPIDRATSVTLHKMAGPYDAHNVDDDRATIETVELGPMDDLSTIRLDEAMGVGSKGAPPGSAFVYVFETE